MRTENKVEKELVRRFRSDNIPRELDRDILSFLMGKTGSGSYVILGIILLLWMLLPIVYFWDEILDRGMILPFVVCFVGIMVMVMPVFIRHRYKVLLTKGQVVEAKFTRIGKQGSQLPIFWLQVETFLRPLCKEFGREYRFMAERTDYEQAVEAFGKGATIYLLIDPEYERSLLRFLFLPRIVVLDLLPQNLGGSCRADEVCNWRFRYVAICLSLVFVMVGSFLMAWPEMNGIIEAETGIPFAVCMLRALPWAIILFGCALFYLYSGRKRYDMMSRLGGFSLIITLSMTSLGAINFSNITLDDSPGEPRALRVTDFFAVTAHRHDSSAEHAFTSYYVAFDVPNDLPDYMLVMVYQTGFDDSRYIPGKEFRLMRHPGFLHMPWYKLLDGFQYYKGIDLDKKASKFILLSAKGYFAKDSRYRAQLVRFGIPVEDLHDKKQ